MAWSWSLDLLADNTRQILCSKNCDFSVKVKFGYFNLISQTFILFSYILPPIRYECIFNSPTCINSVYILFCRGDCCGQRANFVSVYVAKSDQSAQPNDKACTCSFS